jgi:hypothetical protein
MNEAKKEYKQENKKEHKKISTIRTEKSFASLACSRHLGDGCQAVGDVSKLETCGRRQETWEDWRALIHRFHCLWLGFLFGLRRLQVAIVYLFSLLTASKFKCTPAWELSGDLRCDVPKLSTMGTYS